MSKYLLIGGPRNGQYVESDGRMSVQYHEVPEEAKSLTRKPNAADEVLEIHTYRLMRIRDPEFGRFRWAYVHTSVSEEDLGKYLGELFKTQKRVTSRRKR